MTKHWSESLRKLNACDEAMKWARSQPSAKKAWEACERADWLLWIAGRMAKTLAARRRFVSASCACARTALKHASAGEDRPRLAIEAAERWTRGEAEIAEVANAANAAYAAYAAANAAYAAYAAYAAANAAYAASYAVTYRKKALARMADIVRELLPMPRASRAKK